MRIACYWAVPPKSTVDGQLREKKGRGRRRRRRGKEEEEEEKKKEGLLSLRRHRPSVALVLSSPSNNSSPARDGTFPRAGRKIEAISYRLVPCTIPYRDNFGMPVRTGMSNIDFHYYF
ncbi:hypothetical protein GW17_00002289 [Ensete ventricosum]|nr:hypothetical protein GW17_00002289 [Ensete ventricosum]